MNEETPKNVCHHHHATCIEDALATAEKLCSERKQRFTPLRRRVLELVWQSHRPVGAYEILRQLTAEEGCPAPPTVYRALDFLLDQGFIHRINALNAFLGCTKAEEEHIGQMFICKKCKNATELSEPEINQSVKDAAEKQGFEVQEQWLEVVGVCKDCK